MTYKYDNDNIFAKILRKEIKSDIVYENEHTLCFKDAFPKAPVHILIIPKKKLLFWAVYQKII